MALTLEELEVYSAECGKRFIPALVDRIYKPSVLLQMLRKEKAIEDEMIRQAIEDGNLLEGER